jgi:hypothetical protein
MSSCRSTALEDHRTEPVDLFPVARDQRDVQRAMGHWQRNTLASDCIPLLDTFDFSPMKGAWGHRFLICGGPIAETAVFVTYGAGFAKALGLPKTPSIAQPFVEQIPETYRAMFVEGYGKVFIEMVPVTLKGTFSVGPAFELFRAIFMPIMLHPNWSKQLVFGSFNCRTVGAQ